MSNYATLKQNTGNASLAVRRSPLATLRHIQGESFRLGLHHAYLNRIVMEAVAGAGPRFIIVNMPPQHGKSTFFSHATPTWYLSAYPNRKVLLTCYEAEFAASWGARVRRTLRDSPDLFRLTLRKDTDKHFDFNGHDGYMQTAGVGGALTGKGGDLLVVDDPTKNAEQAFSRRHQTRIWDWYRSTVFTRLSKAAVIIIVMTRWATSDLSGRIIAEMEAGGVPYRVVNIPAIAEDGDVLGRRPGEALWPFRQDTAGLDVIRRQLGSYWFNAMFQGKPINRTASIIPPHYWQYYDELPALEAVFTSWDTAYEEGEENDYTVCTTFGISGRGLYILDVDEGRVEFPALEASFARHAGRDWGGIVATDNLIENKASGKSLKQTVRANTRYPVRLIEPRGDKVFRLNLVSGLWESGRVFIPRNAPWTQRVIQQCADFPDADHDDIVDTMSQGAAWALKKYLKDARPAPGYSPTREDRDADRHERSLSRRNDRLRGY